MLHVTVLMRSGVFTKSVSGQTVKAHTGRVLILVFVYIDLIVTRICNFFSRILHNAFLFT